MKTTELDTLLARYYEGLTTRDEERRLRQLLATDDNREHDADRAVFGLLDAKRRLAAKPRTAIVGKRFTWSAAASIAIIFCLGVAAATFTYRAVVAPRIDDASVTSTASVPSENPRSRADGPTLAEPLTFRNQTLADIAKKISAVFGCKVEFADKEAAELRLYLTLPKGCTVSRFVETIDAYDALEATLKANTITIRRQEAQQ